MQRPYYSINGNEAIEIILSDIRQKLEQSGEFGIATTFPMFTWNWKLDMEVYPSEPGKIEVSSGGEKKYSEPKTKGKNVSFGGERKKVGEEVSPDQLRVEAGISLPSPVTKPGIGTVDELLDSLK